MQKDFLDGSQLIVSWNRSEQSLMKKHLMECARSMDLFCFGDLTEVRQLYVSLMRHGILPKTYNYNQIYNQMTISQLVNGIRSAINQHLQKYKGNKSFHGASDYSINSDYETQFLTRFAMAIQDTKKRQTFFPNGSYYYENKANQNCSRICFNRDQTNYITRAKMKLLSLATQLTRIGLNCKTTIHLSNRMRAPANSHEISKLNNIHLIETNNFLDLDQAGHGNVAKFFNMNKLDIGMDGVQYYKNLYRKLFDFALQKEIKDGEQNGKWKIPEFIIPLGGAWGTDLNLYILQALNEVLGENWVRQSQKNVYQGQYRNFISVKIIDTGECYNLAHTDAYPNLKHIGIVNYNNWPPQPLFNDQNKENYMIMAGDHCAFLGNEAMKNGVYGGTVSTRIAGGTYNDSSSESTNMKTDFFKFYGQSYGVQTGLGGYAQKCGFGPNNGAWIMNPLKLEMPQSYLLHCNYQADTFYQIDERQQLQQNYIPKPIVMMPPVISHNNFKNNNFTRRIPMYNG